MAGVVASFPHDAVPDGAVIAPHHAYIGLGLTALAVWVVSDNRPHREALLSAAGCAVLVFGFVLTWRWYAETGAALSLAGALLMLAAPLWPGGEWAGYPVAWRATAALGGVVALDDVAEHAFGIWTPLEAFWMQWLAPLVT